MSKRKSNKHKATSPLVYLCFSLAVLIAAIFMIFAQHTIAFEQDLDNMAEQTVTLQVQQYAERIHTTLYALNEDCQHVSYLVANQNVLDDTSMAASAAASGKIHRAIVCDQYGIGVDQNGESVDISDKEYFKTMTGDMDFSGMFAIRDEKSKMNDEIVTAQQITTKSGVRYLLIYYLSDNMRNYLSNVTCGENTSFVLIDHDGKVLVSEGEDSYKTGDDFWAHIEKSNGGHDTYILEKHVLRNVAGCDDYIYSNGEARKLVYCPLSNENMYLVAEVSGGYLNLLTHGLKSDVGSLKSSVVTVIIIFVFATLMFFIFDQVKTDKTSIQLQEKADTDLLTSLNNKLATERKIKEYMEDNRDTQSAMLLLDIDNFKKINDTLGHAFGDEVLRVFGNHIGSVFRVTDIIGRTGGDEFTVFLKDLKTDDIICGEAVKVSMLFENFQAGGYVKYTVTASIGIAVYPREGESFEDLYKSADIALYKAKKRGKNQIAFHDEKLGEKYRQMLECRKPDDPRI